MTGADNTDGQITQLIAGWLRGDKASETALFDALYRDLHRRALGLIHRRQQQSMGPTALVHEAYLRLTTSESLVIRDREHFMNLAARVMHRILVDHARARLSKKRGGEYVRAEDLDSVIASDADADEVLWVDQALDGLKQKSPRQAQIVELRYFAGFTVEETAAVLGIAEQTVKRDWERARVYLHIAMQGQTPPPPL